jgi:hypothetical protein
VSVSQDELVLHKSVNAGSTGGAEISSLIVSGVKNNLFAQIDDASRIAGGYQAKKFYLYNNAPTDSLVNPSLYLSGPPTYCTDVLGIGAAGSDDADYLQGNMEAFSAAAKVAVASSGADVRTLHITGLNTADYPTAEDVVLNGTNEVLSVTTWNVVYGVSASVIDAARVVQIKEGTGGTVRGSIAQSKKCCWLWVTALSKGAGLRLPDLPAQTSYPIWELLSWAPGVTGVHPNDSVLTVEEN